MAKNRNKDRDSHEKDVKEGKGRSFTKLELLLMLLVLGFGIKYANENGILTSKGPIIYFFDGRSPSRHKQSFFI